jgi:translation elongation factor EF-Ts
LRRKRYSFWINDAEAEGLKAVKADEGISESEQIRQALRDWLRKKGLKKATKRRSRTRRKG